MKMVTPFGITSMKFYLSIPYLNTGVPEFTDEFDAALYPYLSKAIHTRIWDYRDNDFETSHRNVHGESVRTTRARAEEARPKVGRDRKQLDGGDDISYTRGKKEVDDSKNDPNKKRK